MVSVSGADPFVLDDMGGLDHVATPAEMADDELTRASAVIFNSMAESLAHDLADACLADVADLEAAMATPDESDGVLVRLSV